jgi:uncharacterized protein (DUF1778 family)
MPRPAVEDNSRMNFRMTAEAKSRIARAAALKNSDLTHFVTQAALREADAVIAEAERIQVSERDHMRIMTLLECPPAPNDRLVAAAKALPKAV